MYNPKKRKFELITAICCFVMAGLILAQGVWHFIQELRGFTFSYLADVFTEGNLLYLLFFSVLVAIFSIIGDFIIAVAFFATGGFLTLFGVKLCKKPVQKEDGSYRGVKKALVPIIVISAVITGTLLIANSVEDIMWRHVWFLPIAAVALVMSIIAISLKNPTPPPAEEAIEKETAPVEELVIEEGSTADPLEEKMQELVKWKEEGLLTEEQYKASVDAILNQLK